MNRRGIYGFKDYVFIDDDICYLSGGIPLRITNDNCCFLNGWKVPLEIIRKLEYQKGSEIPDFMISEFETIVQDIKSKRKQKPERGIRKIIVSKCDLSGNFICEYDSIAEAAKAAGVSRQAIMQCLSGKSKQSAGFKWSLTDN